MSIATSMTYSGVDVATRRTPEGRDMSRPDRIAIAVLALPIAVVAGTILGALANAAAGDESGGTAGGWIGTVSAGLCWGAALVAAYRPVIGRKALGKAAAIVVATSLGFFVEIFVALICLVTLVGIPLYFVALVFVPVQVNKTVRKRRADEGHAAA